MAIGYIYLVKEGKTTFRKFALECARQLSPVVYTEMEELPSGTPIPDEFKPHPYHKEEIERAKKNLERAKAMTIEEAEIKVEGIYNECIRSNNETRKKREETRVRYESMLEKVRAWDPPTPDHTNLKDFMISELEQSIERDCPTSCLSEPERQTGEEYKAILIRQAESDIARHEKGWEEDVKGAREITDWVRALKDSLPEE